MQIKRLCYCRQWYRSHDIQFVNDERQREVAGKHRLGCQNNLGVFESRLLYQLYIDFPSEPQFLYM